MELQKDMRPDSARFTAARDITIVSELGNMCARFEAGQTKKIPKALFNAALISGLIPEDDLELAAPVTVENKPKEVMISDGLQEACKTLISRANPEDFTMTGFPRAASAKKLVDFDFTAADLRVAFEEAMHEVEQDGDDSKEPAESDSVTA